MIIYLSYDQSGGVAVDADQFQRIAKALADPRRFEILEHIASQSEVGCSSLCGCFPVRQATISHHLKELSSAGLVESRKDGQFVFYRTRPVVLEAYMTELRRRVEGPVSPGGRRSRSGGGTRRENAGGSRGTQSASPSARKVPSSRPRKLAAGKRK